MLTLTDFKFNVDNKLLNDVVGNVFVVSVLIVILIFLMAFIVFNPDNSIEKNILNVFLVSYITVVLLLFTYSTIHKKRLEQKQSNTEVNETLKIMNSSNLNNIN